MAEFLQGYVGFEYLAVVPQDLRSQVALMCGMSPTISSLRSAMRSYGRLSDEVSQIAVVEPHFVRYQLSPSSAWATYWYALLLEPEEDTPEFKHEMSRRLGLPHLSSDKWKLTQVADVNHAVNGDCISLISLNKSDTSNSVVEPNVVEEASVTELLFGNDGLLGVDCIDKFTSRLSNRDTDSRVLMKSYADFIMDEYGFPECVGSVSVDQDVNSNGYCYLQLFHKYAAGDVLNILGTYPTSKAVAALYYAGLVYGFSCVKDVKLICGARCGVQGLTTFHVEYGDMNCVDIFDMLRTNECLVGCDVNIPEQDQLGASSLDENVFNPENIDFKQFWSQLEMQKYTLVSLLAKPQWVGVGPVDDGIGRLVSLSPGLFSSSGWQMFEAKPRKFPYVAWVPSGYRVATESVRLFSIRYGVLVFVNSDARLTIERHSGVTSDVISRFLKPGVSWSSELETAFGSKHDIFINVNYSDSVLHQFEDVIGGCDTGVDLKMMKIFNASLVVHKFPDVCNSSSYKKLKRFEVSEPYDSTKPFSVHRLLGHLDTIYSVTMHSHDVVVCDKFFTKFNLNSPVVFNGVLSVIGSDVGIGFSFDLRQSLVVKSADHFSFNFTRVHDVESFDLCYDSDSY